VAIVGLCMVLSSFAVAQDFRSEASGSFMGRFTGTTNVTNVVQSPSSSGGLLASYRFAFKQHSALEFSYARSKNDQSFLTIDTLNGVQHTYFVSSSNQEWGLSYVYAFHKEKKISPFVLGGGAALTLNPTNTNNDTGSVSIPAQKQTLGAVIYGFGADYKYKKHWFVRLQYRGLIYKAPDFNIGTLDVSTQFTTNRWVHTAEPSLGVVFKF
jgi:opacity protein-like surface antigen